MKSLNGSIEDRRVEDLDDDGELLLIRHAESEWNVSGRWQGHADPPLSLRGRAQARELATKLVAELEGDSVDLLVCSDLRRTRETAEAVGRALGLRPQPGACYRELDVGSWAGLTREEIHALDGELLARFEASDPDARPGGGETRREIRVRARGAVRELIRANPGARIVLVSHLGFLRALVPGADPGNAELIRVQADAVLALRPDAEQDAPRDSREQTDG